MVKKLNEGMGDNYFDFKVTVNIMGAVDIIRDALGPNWKVGGNAETEEIDITDTKGNTLNFKVKPIINGHGNFLIKLELPYEYERKYISMYGYGAPDLIKGMKGKTLAKEIKFSFGSLFDYDPDK